MWLGWASQRSAASRHGAAAVQGSVEKKVSYELATALADTYRDVVQREFYDQLNLSMPVAVLPVRLCLGVITQSCEEFIHSCPEVFITKNIKNMFPVGLFINNYGLTFL